MRSNRKMAQKEHITTTTTTTAATAAAAATTSTRLGPILPKCKNKHYTHLYEREFADVSRSYFPEVYPFPVQGSADYDDVVVSTSVVRVTRIPVRGRHVHVQWLTVDPLEVRLTARPRSAPHAWGTTGPQIVEGERVICAAIGTANRVWLAG